jgi:hypothetical protein
LRVRPDQAGTLVRCWSCGHEVAVPYPRQQGRLVQALADAAVTALRPPTLLFVAAGAMLITATLLVPGGGPWMALLLMVVAAWGYEDQFCFGIRLLERNSPERPRGPDITQDAVPESPTGMPARASPLWWVIVRVILGAVSVGVLVAPFVIRNQGYLLPPARSSPRVLAFVELALLGWLMIPLVSFTVMARDRIGPLPPRLALAALVRHPAATLAAVLVLPLGLVLIEGLLIVIAWQQGQLPLMILDNFPPPRLVRAEDGRHALFNYDGRVFDLQSMGRPEDLIQLYPRGLRRGFTLLGTIPLSLSVGRVEVRVSPRRFQVQPAQYMATRIAATALILTGAGLLLTIQARWLGLIAALDSRRPAAGQHPSFGALPDPPAEPLDRQAGSFTGP